MKKNILLSINKQNGQALLIVVLVMVVALTVGLSIASKSITSFRNSTDTANSQKALSAAEAGIEQALKSNTSIPITSISQDAKYKTDVAAVGGPGVTTFMLNGGNPVLQSSGIDLWLTAYSNISANLYQNPYQGSNFTVYWGDSSGGCNNAALEVVVITGTRASPVLSKYAFDPCASRQNSNHFAACLADGSQGCVSGQYSGIPGRTFYYQATIPAAGGLVARIVPLYASAIMAVKGTSEFPTQGSVITSVGSSGTTERRVNVFQGYPEIPAEYYLYNLFVP